MEKKGFTLVEVLAVIVILAVLTILVLPNALKLYKDSKVRAFTSEIREIYRVANNQYVLDKTLGGFEMVYSKVSSSDCENKLPLSGRSNMEYYVKYNGQGKIIQFYATDGSYQYIYDGDGLRLDQIEDVIEVSKVADGRFIKLTCTTASIIKPPPESPDSYLMAGTNGRENTNYLRTTIKKQNIEKITFTDSLGTHSTSESNCWDVSAGQNGDVLVWAEDSNNNGKYELTIGANGDIYASNGYYLFGYLTNLKSINGMQYFNTSAVSNMSYMFLDCYNLTTLDLIHFDTSSVTDMSHMFRNCDNLTVLNISHFDTSNVTNMSYMFYCCSGLTSLDLSAFNTSQVTNMSYMFDSCSSLTTLDLSHFDTSKVTNVSYMFYNCNNLISLDVSHFNTSNVTEINSMFSNCSKITTLDVSHFDTLKVTNMSSMFNNCSSLTALDISHFNTSNVTNMSSMFYGCNNLISLDVSHFDTSKVTDMSNMFSSCAKLTSIDLSHFDTSNVTNMMGMFNNCSSLTTLDLSDFNTSKTTNMSYMFSLCKSLTTLDVSHFDTSNVANMWSMFSECKSLTSLDISSFNTSKIWDTESMFRSNPKLETIYVGNNFNNSNISRSNNMFDGCIKIVGGAGTTYDSRHIDKEYARIDAPENGNPGYFTLKSN